MKDVKIDPIAIESNKVLLIGIGNSGRGDDGRMRLHRQCVWPYVRHAAARHHLFHTEQQILCRQLHGFAVQCVTRSQSRAVEAFDQRRSQTSDDARLA